MGRARAETPRPLTDLLAAGAPAPAGTHARSQTRLGGRWPARPPARCAPHSSSCASYTLGFLI